MTIIYKTFTNYSQILLYFWNILNLKTGWWILLKTKNEKTNLAIVNFSTNFSTINTATLEKLCFKIYPNRLKKANKLNPSKKKISLASFLLAIFCIKNNLKISNFEFFKLGGKPHLTAKNAFFNISHTQNAIACATSTCPIGIDLEKIKLINLKLAKKICCQAELTNFLKLTNQQKKIYLIKIWTMKESFSKMNAKPVFQNLKKINHKKINNLKCFTFNKFILSVCTKTTKKILIQELDFNKIIIYLNKLILTT